jgi:4-amino-4-deoxy-L-arabinose transferase-like glycosyltransferase
MLKTLSAVSMLDEQAAPEQSKSNVFGNSVWLMLALISGLVIRIVFIEAVVPKMAFEDNGVFFLEMARSLKEHGDPFAVGSFVNRFDRGPLVAYFTLAVAGFMDTVSACRYASMVAGCAVIPLVYLIARRLVPDDRRVASLAALTTAWFPLLIEMSVLGYDDMLSGLMFTLIVSVLVCSAAEPRYRVRAAVLAGVATSLGYLTRPTGLAMIGVVVVVWMFLARMERTGWKGWVIPSAVSLLAFAIVSAPYVAFISNVMGRFTLTAKTMVNLIWMTESPDRNYELVGDELMSLVALRDLTPLQYIMEHARQFTIAAVTGIQWMLTDHLAHALSLPIAAIAFHGFVSGKWNTSRIRVELPVVLSILSLVIPLAILGTLTTRFGRYLIPIIPLQLIWFSKGLLELTDRAESLRGSLAGVPLAKVVRYGAFGALALYLVAGLAAGPGIKFVVSANREYLRAAQATGEWLDAHIPKDSVICSSNNNIAFAANRSSVPQFVRTASTTDAQVKGYFDRYKVEYLVIEQDSPLERAMADTLSELTLLYTSPLTSRSIRVFQR